METLPDDVVLEILVRVPDVPDVFRCAATCKRWRLLVAHPSFLRRRWPEDTHHPSSLLGFFAEQWMDDSIVSSFIRASSSLLGPQWRVASSFPDASRVVPLAARRGLLLVRLARGFEESHLAVCDPLTDTNCVLPPLRCNELFKIRGYAILTGTDFCSNKQRRQSMPFFKVLMIGVPGGDNPHYNLRVFSSDESSWSVPKECFDALEHGIKAAPLHADAVVCQGTAHWLFRNKSSFHTLNVSVETGHATLTKLPVTPSHLGRNFRDVPRLGVTNGVLSLVALHRKCLRVQVWTCQGDKRSGGNWLHTKTIDLQRPKQGHSKMVGWVYVGERSGTLLIKETYDSERMYVADLQTGATEEVTDRFCKVYFMPIPFEIDWPTFFHDSLGAQWHQAGSVGRSHLNIATHFWDQKDGQQFSGQLL